MRAHEFITEAPTTYYHGTQDESAAKAILDSGTLIPGDHTGKEPNNLTPIVNRTYITSNLGYAMIYAVGGDIIGNSAAANLEGNGYIFKIHKANIKNRIPDEDVVGELARDIVADMDDHGFQDDEIRELKSIVDDAFEYDIELSPEDEEDSPDFSAYDRFISHEYEFFAAVGKIILAKGSKRLIASFRRISQHHSGEGEMAVDAAWVFKKSDGALMQKNGSDFFDYATQIR